MLAACGCTTTTSGPTGRTARACRADPESFFDPKRADEALSTCARCEVRAPCAWYAEANDEQFGMGRCRPGIHPQWRRRGRTSDRLTVADAHHESAPDRIRTCDPRIRRPPHQVKGGM